MQKDNGLLAENKNLTDSQKKTFEANKLQLLKSKKRINIINKLKDATMQLTEEQKKIYLENPNVSTALSAVAKQTESLKGLAQTYNLVKEGQLSQLDIMGMVAKDSKLLAALDVDSTGKLMLKASAIEAMGKTTIEEAKIAVDAEINKLEAQKIALEGAAPIYQAQYDLIIGVKDGIIQYDTALSDNTTNVGTNLGNQLTSLNRWRISTVAGLNNVAAAWDNHNKVLAGGANNPTGLSNIDLNASAKGTAARRQLGVC